MGSLPEEKFRLLPDHVEVFDFDIPAGAEPVERSLKVQSALTKELELIVPKPQRPPEQAKAPSKPSVRYFDPSTKVVADNIARTVAAALGLAPDALEVPDKPNTPSQSDLQLYRDMTKHFELWMPATTPSPSAP
jgi:hypothetical protein